MNTRTLGTLLTAALALSAAGNLRGSDTIKAKELKPKSLPVEIVSKLVKGYDSENVSWSWKSPEFAKSEGFKLDGFLINTDERNGDLFDQLRRRLEMESDPSSSNSLHLVMVDYWPGTGTDDRWMEIEGLVKRGGKVVGAFVTRNSYPKRDGLLGMTDDFMRDLNNFRRK